MSISTRCYSVAIHVAAIAVDRIEELIKDHYRSVWMADRRVERLRLKFGDDVAELNKQRAKTVATKTDSKSWRLNASRPCMPTNTTTRQNSRTPTSGPSLK